MKTHIMSDLNRRLYTSERIELPPEEHFRVASGDLITRGWRRKVVTLDGPFTFCSRTGVPMVSMLDPAEATCLTCWRMATDLIARIVGACDYEKFELPKMASLRAFLTQEQAPRGLWQLQDRPAPDRQGVVGATSHDIRTS